ncbi:hypothetical protein SBOR_1177 [Sclerotinia borealis F-4128]|uniref:Uncharacterized protein n=1 Tax=Sclerotinia borealis (strain F-4128) TaxID=1432307 RepID=W9CVF1_SCLBF|nr:hypothetical protein SBOR_1177 [Sclerotinia borealis F-4128]
MKLSIFSPRKNPSLIPSAIFSTYRSAIQTTFSATELPGVKTAYMSGIRMAFALSVAMSGVATLVALSQGWIRMKKGDELATQTRY